MIYVVYLYVKSNTGTWRLVSVSIMFQDNFFNTKSTHISSTLQRPNIETIPQYPIIVRRIVIPATIITTVLLNSFCVICKYTDL